MASGHIHWASIPFFYDDAVRSYTRHSAQKSLGIHVKNAAVSSDDPAEVRLPNPVDRPPPHLRVRFNGWFKISPEFPVSGYSV